MGPRALRQPGDVRLPRKARRHRLARDDTHPFLANLRLEAGQATIHAGDRQSTPVDLPTDLDRAESSRTSSTRSSNGPVSVPPPKKMPSNSQLRWCRNQVASACDSHLMKASTHVFTFGFVPRHGVHIGESPVEPSPGRR